MVGLKAAVHLAKDQAQSVDVHLFIIAYIAGFLKLRTQVSARSYIRGQQSEGLLSLLEEAPIVLWGHGPLMVEHGLPKLCLLHFPSEAEVSNLELPSLNEDVGGL